jgi:2-oxoglutarate ferredoxin oxidoreductase subunit alpha
VIVLAPSTVQELFDLTLLGFELADKYSNPAMILGDGILGQMREPLVLRDPVSYDPGVKSKWALGNSAGRAKHVITSVRLAPGTLEKHNMKLFEKYKRIEESEQRYELTDVEDADVVIVAYGTSARVAKSAVAMAKESGGIKLGLIRLITLWPYPKKIIREYADKGKKLLVVEMSLGQMYEDALLATCGKTDVSLLAHTGGGLPTEEEILETAKKVKASDGPLEVYPEVSE